MHEVRSAPLGQRARFPAAPAGCLPPRTTENGPENGLDVAYPLSFPTVGTLRLLGIPFKLHDTPATVRRPPPTLGQHTEEILRAELGLTEARIRELRALKVI